MKRLSGLLCAAGSVLGLFAASAQALPPIFDRVPTNALVVVSTPSLEQLEKSVASITTTLELPFPGVKQMLMMQGFDAGVDMTKAVAAVVMPPADNPGDKPAKKPADPNDPMADEEPREEPPLILLVPTGDYKALLKAFNVEAGAGITEFVGPEGDPGFAKDIGGGYAAISNKKDVLEKFDGKPGNAKAHSELIGKIGNSIGERADLLVIANIPALAPIVQPMIEQGMADAMEGPLAMMGGEMNMEGAEAAMKAFFDQTNGAVMALDIEPSGVAIEGSAQYKAGTMLAGAFAKGGNSSTLIGKLPSQPYLVNYAVDVSQPAWKQLVKDTMNSSAEPGEQAPGTNLLIANIDNADGMASSVGFSPAALFGGGLLVNTTSYIKTSKPAEFIAGAQKMLTELNGKTVAGSAYTTTFTKAGAKVNNVDVDVWEVKMAPAEDGDPMAAQAAMMMFGPNGGPGGFMAPVEGGVVTTMAKNQLLMGASMDAAAKGTNSMNDDAMTKQVAERLPKGRVAEAYIGVKSIMESVKPMLAMMGGPAQFDIPEQLPPVGAGLGAGDSASHFTLFVPMPVIKTIGAAVKAMNQPPAGGPAPAAQPGQPAGQPRF